MTENVKRIVEEGHLGVRTYQEFIEECLQRCAAGDEDTVSLFVLAKLVQPFSDYYQDQALTEAEAVAFRQRLLSHIAVIETAKDPGERLDRLHEIIEKELNAGLW